MAEPASPAAGVGLAAALMAALGPVVGEYATIVFAALAGATWPLAQRADITRMQGALLVLRLVMTAAVLTSVVAWWIERTMQVPAATALAPVAFLISALGERWTGLLDSLAESIKARFGGARPPGDQPGGRP